MRTFLLLLFVALFTSVQADDVTLQQVYDAGLTVVRIETVNGEMPTYDEVMPPPSCMGLGITNATKVPGRVTIEKGGVVLYDSGEYEEDISGMTIKVRGKSTAWKTKKPYKIKLQKKADLLRRGNNNKYEDKNWLLIRDEMLYTKIGFKLNELMGMQWTPAYEYVNVIFNGDYVGVYMLAESVRRNTSCRLNVDKTGYVFEYDAYWWNEDVYVECSRNIPMHFTFKYPDSEEITEQQISAFTDMIRKVEKSIDDGSFEDYIDVNSFVSWLLAQDILGNWDAAGSNYFLTKYDNTDNSKVAFGLLWDFDKIFSTENEWCTAHQGGWFYYTYLLDYPSFVKAYKAKWEEMAPTVFDELINELDAFEVSETGKAFDESIVLNNIRWIREYEPVSQCVQNAKDWFNERKVWLADAIENMEIPASIKTIENNGSQDKDKTIYNLQGQRVTNPSKGIYIQNGKKIVWK